MSAQPSAERWRGSRDLPEEERSQLRQDAYRNEFKARSAIGQVAFLSR
jgi:hypothetical protein